MATKAMRLDIKSNKFPALALKLGPAISQVVEDTAQDIASEVKSRNASKRIGKTITVRRPNALSRLVVAGSSRAFHPGFIEYGTRDQVARPFMTPAAEAHRSKFNRAIARAVDGL